MSIPETPYYVAAQILVLLIAFLQTSFLVAKAIRGAGKWASCYVASAQTLGYAFTLTLYGLGALETSGAILTNADGARFNLLRYIGWYVTCPVMVSELANMERLLVMISAKVAAFERWRKVVGIKRSIAEEGMYHDRTNGRNNQGAVDGAEVEAWALAEELESTLEQDVSVNPTTAMAIMLVMLSTSVLMAAATSSIAKVLYFALGGSLCSYLFFKFGSVFTLYMRTLPGVSSAKVLLPLFIGSWLLFPVVTLLSPLGFDIVDDSVSDTMFALADIPAKNILLMVMGRVQGKLADVLHGVTMGVEGIAVNNDNINPSNSNNNNIVESPTLASPPIIRAKNINIGSSSSMTSSIPRSLANVSPIVQSAKREIANVSPSLLSRGIFDIARNDNNNYNYNYSNSYVKYPASIQKNGGYTPSQLKIRNMEDEINRYAERKVIHAATKQSSGSLPVIAQRYHSTPLYNMYNNSNEGMQFAPKHAEHYRETPHIRHPRHDVNKNDYDYDHHRDSNYNLNHDHDHRNDHDHHDHHDDRSEGNKSPSIYVQDGHALSYGTLPGISPTASREASREWSYDN